MNFVLKIGAIPIEKISVCLQLKMNVLQNIMILVIKLFIYTNFPVWLLFVLVLNCDGCCCLFPLFVSHCHRVRLRQWCRCRCCDHFLLRQNVCRNCLRFIIFKFLFALITIIILLLLLLSHRYFFVNFE